MKVRYNSYIEIKHRRGVFMSKYLSSQAALAELGSRIKLYRILASLTQDDLAKMSGVSRRSIQYMEKGEDVKFTTVIKVLIALDLDSNLDLLVPDSTRRPSYFLKTNSNTKHRLRASKKVPKSSRKVFKWGDES